MAKRKTLWIAAAILVLAFSAAVSQLAFGGDPQIKAVGVLAACLILWISQALPISISTLLLIALLPFLGLMDLEEILSKFGVNTALFIMASSGITVALSSSAVPRYLTNTVLQKSGDRPRLLVFSTALVVAVFSAFVSSLATCALFTALIVAALRESGLKPAASNLGKDLMLIIPACAGIGGFMSPAGTPANILVIDLLKQRGIEVSFLKWCAVGFPVGLFAVLLFAASVVLVFPPESKPPQLPHTEIAFSAKDKWTILIVLLVIAGWFAGSFIPALSTTLVASIGLAVMFVPALGLMDLDSFRKGVNWDLVLAMGSVSVLMTAVSNTGLLSHVAKTVFGQLSGASPFGMLILLSLAICVIRSVVPTTTAVVALFAPLLLSVAETTGLSDAPLLLLVSFWAASALLLIFTEPIYLISYKEGYFSESDLLKTGALPSLLLSVAATLGIYGLSSLLGL